MPCDLDRIISRGLAVLPRVLGVKVGMDCCGRRQVSKHGDLLLVGFCWLKLLGGHRQLAGLEPVNRWYRVLGPLHIAPGVRRLVRDDLDRADVVVNCQHLELELWGGEDLQEELAERLVKQTELVEDALAWHLIVGVLALRQAAIFLRLLAFLLSIFVRDGGVEERSGIVARDGTLCDGGVDEVPLKHLLEAHSHLRPRLGLGAGELRESLPKFALLAHQAVEEALEVIGLLLLDLAPRRLLCTKSCRLCLGRQFLCSLVIGP
mmetsp:Transcript_29772/g.79514  ORF Transcript_29772/g.79514 Transcript_29772/m.79514 type:complete len:263 (+) Transcript_29772:263-1051(+)